MIYAHVVPALWQLGVCNVFVFQLNNGSSFCSAWILESSGSQSQL